MVRDIPISAWKRHVKRVGFLDIFSPIGGKVAVLLIYGVEGNKPGEVGSSSLISTRSDTGQKELNYCAVLSPQCDVLLCY